MQTETPFGIDEPEPVDPMEYLPTMPGSKGEPALDLRAASWSRFLINEKCQDHGCRWVDCPECFTGILVIYGQALGQMAVSALMAQAQPDDGVVRTEAGLVIPRGPGGSIFGG